MEVELDGKVFKVFVTRKNIKNMYLKVKADGLHISCHYLVTKGMILNFITDNQDSILKSDELVQKKEKKKEEFYYLGKRYDVVLLNTISKIQFNDDTVFVKNKTYLNTFLKNEAERIFNERFKICYDLFEENIPYPKVLIGKMKRKWGYCNARQKIVKLNFDLIYYSIDEIDYVIIHELCHLLEFNHSPRFWKLVKKYKPNYKENQRILKEE